MNDIYQIMSKKHLFKNNKYSQSPNYFNIFKPLNKSENLI